MPGYLPTYPEMLKIKDTVEANTSVGADSYKPAQYKYKECYFSHMQEFVWASKKRM